jgi:hypothetical protein
VFTDQGDSRLTHILPHLFLIVEYFIHFNQFRQEERHVKTWTWSRFAARAGADILVIGYFVTSLRAFLSEAILLKSRDCFGKKRLAMTAILTRNEYIFQNHFDSRTAVASSSSGAVGRHTHAAFGNFLLDNLPTEPRAARGCFSGAALICVMPQITGGDNCHSGRILFKSSTMLDRNKMLPA